MFAKGRLDSFVYNPGDDPGNAIWCTNLEFLEKYRYGVDTDPIHGVGQLLYRIEVIDDENASCEE